jgi:hypothetical protein
MGNSQSRQVQCVGFSRLSKGLRQEFIPLNRPARPRSDTFGAQPQPHLEAEAVPMGPPPDFREIKGQEHVKRALEIAAAGGHNVMMVGPPEPKGRCWDASSSFNSACRVIRLVIDDD